MKKHLKKLITINSNQKDVGKHWHKELKEMKESVCLLCYTWLNMEKMKEETSVLHSTQQPGPQLTVSWFKKNKYRIFFQKSAKSFPTWKIGAGRIQSKGYTTGKRILVAVSVQTGKWEMMVYLNQCFNHSKKIYSSQVWERASKQHT